MSDVALASVSHISLMHRPYGPRVHLNEGEAASEAAPVLMPATGADDTGLTPYQAMEAYAKRKNSPAVSADTATAENELPDEGNTEPETVHGEDEEVEAGKEPPIDRPKSWSKDEDAEWQSLPRAMQQKIVARESERDRGTTQRQQKAADAEKAAEAKAAQAEQARQQYEGKLKSAMEVLEREQLRDFADIKTFADIEKMAAEDPFRKMQWDVHQQRMQLVAHEAQQAEGRKADAKRTEQNTRRLSETAKLIEKIPEFADKTKLDAAQKAAVQLFRDIGYSDTELAALGDEPLLDDHRIQVLVNDAMKYRAMQKAKTAVAAKPVPPVLRPGNSTPNRGAQDLSVLRNKLNSSGDVNDAFAVYQAKKSARRA